MRRKSREYRFRNTTENESQLIIIFIVSRKCFLKSIVFIYLKFVFNILILIFWDSVARSIFWNGMQEKYPDIIESIGIFGVFICLFISGIFGRSIIPNISDNSWLENGSFFEYSFARGHHLHWNCYNYSTWENYWNWTSTSTNFAWYVFY